VVAELQSVVHTTTACEIGDTQRWNDDILKLECHKNSNCKKTLAENVTCSNKRAKISKNNCACATRSACAEQLALPLELML
jgi:hypothetical protein